MRRSCRKERPRRGETEGDDMSELPCKDVDCDHADCEWLRFGCKVCSLAEDCDASDDDCRHGFEVWKRTRKARRDAGATA